MELNSVKYKMRAPRIPYLFKMFRFNFWHLLHQYSCLCWGFHLDICAPKIWTDLIRIDSILTDNTSRQLTILGFSPWYMFHGNLQHHLKLSNKPLKLNSAKYKMRAPRIWNLFDKYRLDFWQLLHQYSQ